jgi:hypothetical protein
MEANPRFRTSRQAPPGPFRPAARTALRPGSWRTLVAHGRLAGALVLAACLMQSGCSYSPPKPTTRLATVVRIEQPLADILSPRKQGSAGPLTKIYLRAGSDSGPVRDMLVVVDVLGPYKASLLGEPGDVVTLTYPGTLQSGAEIAFEDLVYYKVTAKPSAPVP